MDINFIQL